MRSQPKKGSEEDLPACLLSTHMAPILLTGEISDRNASFAVDWRDRMNCYDVCFKSEDE